MTQTDGRAEIQADHTPMSAEWHYHPDLPLSDPSVFHWPPRAGFLARWFARNWLINLVTLCAVAGGLRWWFYMRGGQGKELKFDKRDQARGNRLWNFSNRVHDNMFWSLTSGVGQMTAYQVLVLWAMANEYAPVLTFAEKPVWFVLALILPVKDKRRLALGTFYHQLHHRFYECDSGNQGMPLDRWLGAFHDGSSEATSRIRARKKRMHAG